MNLEPMSDRIVVQVYKADEMTPGGIHIPNTAQEKPQMAVVIAVGPGRETEGGRFIPTTLKKGDKILFGKHTGCGQIVDGQKYLILRESDVLAKVLD